MNAFVFGIGSALYKPGTSAEATGCDTALARRVEEEVFEPVAGLKERSEAAPIIDALTRAATPASDQPSPRGRGRRVRIRVSEKGRRVVDLRVPLGLAAMAARMAFSMPCLRGRLPRSRSSSPRLPNG